LQQNGALYQLVKDMMKEIRDLKQITKQLQASQDSGLSQKVMEVRRISDMY
jgi:hypothetical protein